MAKTNTKTRQSVKTTHEGVPAARINAAQQLQRLVCAHLLWEDTFYTDGKSAADAVASAIKNVPAEKVMEMAITARGDMKLRHVPLFMARTMAGLKTHRHVVADTLAQVIQRPDELTEYVALYWSRGQKRIKLSAQSKRGLARAFRKFNEYQLAKYDREGDVRLRDVLFLCHAKPMHAEQDALWKRLKDGQLATPDTWEVAIKTKGDKQEWTRLLKEDKMGALALLRNLRNLREAGVDQKLIFEALAKMNVARVLPFRFVSAAQHNPQFEPQIEEAMLRAVAELPKLPGKTALVVDVSGSMYTTKVSKKSELERVDAACAQAILAREMCEQVVVIAYSENPYVVAGRRGFALRDSIKNVKGAKGGTNTRYALDMAAREGYDRIIVITDEQSHQAVVPPEPNTKGYFMNVSCEQNGIGYGKWVHLDGFSEALLRYIAVEEGINFAPTTEQD